ncbi:MbtH family NRPS accessory protein [Streptomyces sp. TRM68416]|uniref:MbtH family NRPS accessory protein n=1 Tax=Streptomyces sp. TRM68416 TaxID=2758412 RepID=UPI001661A901|nr:MbtH family NRPS accessory protein [Streptomyces sp. TRM68416]MBD0843987.1 MbtH family protein [Streptomyces sp. TRM68416]
MTRQSGPFDPGHRHLVLENSERRLSLWPAWRAVPPGWEVRFGPAPHKECVLRVEVGRR